MGQKSNEMNSQQRAIASSEFVPPAPLPPDVQKIIKELPPAKQAILLRGMNVTASFHSGPIPPAPELAAYNQIIPHGADRIMKMAEEQSQHRMSIEKIVIPAQTGLAARGQWFALIIALFCVGCGTYCVVNGHEKSGVSIAGGTVIALVSAFMYDRKRQIAELKSKKPQANQSLDKKS